MSCILVVQDPRGRFRSSVTAAQMSCLFLVLFPCFCAFPSVILPWFDSIFFRFQPCFRIPFAFLSSLTPSLTVISCLRFFWPHTYPHTQTHAGYFWVRRYSNRRRTGTSFTTRCLAAPVHYSRTNSAPSEAWKNHAGVLHLSLQIQLVVISLCAVVIHLVDTSSTRHDLSFRFFSPCPLKIVRFVSAHRFLLCSLSSSSPPFSSPLAEVRRYHWPNLRTYALCPNCVTPAGSYSQLLIPVGVRNSIVIFRFQWARKYASQKATKHAG